MCIFSDTVLLMVVRPYSLILYCLEEARLTSISGLFSSPRASSSVALFQKRALPLNRDSPCTIQACTETPSRIFALVPSTGQLLAPLSSFLDTPGYRTIATGISRLSNPQTQLFIVIRRSVSSPWASKESLWISSSKASMPSPNPNTTHDYRSKFREHCLSTE